MDLVQPKADAVMFFLDLVMFVKSREMNKSVLDMNTHYLEL